MATRIVVDHRATNGVAAPAAPLRHPEKAHRPDNPVRRKPDWIRVKAPTHPVYHETRALMRENRLVTVCEEAACPNIGECWSQRHATMMIMGDTCTRACSPSFLPSFLPLLSSRNKQHFLDKTHNLSLPSSSSSPKRRLLLGLPFLLTSQRRRKRRKERNEG